jgi:hypothetical protein
MRLLVLALCLSGAACTTPPRPAPPDVEALRARLGSASCVAAALLVRIVPVDAEGELFTLRVWSPADGRVRVIAHKLDVDFLSALVAADGSYTAVLPREKIWTRGRLGGAGDPLLLRDLSLLVAEIRHGPLPPDAAAVSGPGRTLGFPDRATGWEAVLNLGVDGLPVGKRLLAADGGEQRRLSYDRWQGFDGLLRPSVVGLTVAGDPGSCTVRLKSLDAPPTISDERMTLRLPEAAVEVAPAELARRIGG